MEKEKKKRKIISKAQKLALYMKPVSCDESLDEIGGGKWAQMKNYETGFY